MSLKFSKKSEIHTLHFKMSFEIDSPCLKSCENMIRKMEWFWRESIGPCLVPCFPWACCPGAMSWGDHGLLQRGSCLSPVSCLNWGSGEYMGNVASSLSLFCWTLCLPGRTPIDITWYWDASDFPNAPARLWKLIPESEETQFKH